MKWATGYGICLHGGLGTILFRYLSMSKCHVDGFGSDTEDSQGKVGWGVISGLPPLAISARRLLAEVLVMPKIYPSDNPWALKEGIFFF